MRKKLTKDYFIKRSIEIHGTLYDYSKVEYINNRTKVIIIDPDYGEFEQTPSNHMKGHGSKERQRINSIKDKNYQLNNFIKQANIIHNNLYDYSKSIYVNCNTKLIIIDPDYGEFEQSPYSHINLKRGHIKRKTLSDKVCKQRKNKLIQESENLYGKIHDFTNFIFSGNHIDSIFCDIEYGFYTAKPRNHLRYNSIHPQRKIDNRVVNKIENDHIIPLSIICSAKERSKSYTKNRPLYKLLNSKINLKEVPTTNNRIKNDYIFYQNKKISARTVRNNYDIISELLLTILKISKKDINEIILEDKNYLNKIVSK